MARKIRNVGIKSYRGTPFRVAARELSGDMIWENKDAQIPVYRAADVRDILDELIILFPRDIMTNQDTIHGARLYDQIHSADDGLLVIEEAEWEWVLKKIEEDRVGPRMFGMNTYSIAEQLRELGRDTKDGARSPPALEDAGVPNTGAIPNRATRRRQGKPLPAVQVQDNHVGEPG